MTKFSEQTKQATCAICLLAQGMKDCKACAFYVEYPRATPADIDRMWKRLWGDLTPEQAQLHARYLENEYNLAQLRKEK